LERDNQDLLDRGKQLPIRHESIYGRLKIPDFRLKMGIPPINRGRLAYLLLVKI
jgi:hypothetical protein